MFEKIEKKLSPIAEKIAANVYLKTATEGMTHTLPLIMVGSILLLIVSFPVDAIANAVAGIHFGNCYLSDVLIKASSATTDLLGFYSTLAIAYRFAKVKKLDPLPATLVALSIYFFMMPLTEAWDLPAHWLGAYGLIVGMVIAFVSLNIYSWAVNKGWTIKMPNGVPPAVGAAFAGLIPTLFTFGVFSVIYIIFSAFGSDLFNFLYNLIQAPLSSLTTSLGGFLVIYTLSSIFWLLGIHGGAALDVVYPLLVAANATNLQYFTTGEGSPVIICESFLTLFAHFGGSGSILALVIGGCLIAKSKRVKEMSKVGLIPAIFEISEPVVYGMPTMLNPTLAIPFILAPTVNILVTYFVMAAGIVSVPSGVTVPWTCPPIISGFLLCGVGGSILQCVTLTIDILIYLPFVKMYDNKCLKDEQSGSKKSEEDDIDLNNIDLDNL